MRFNSADSAYLNRTPSSAGNRKTFTYSAWAKRSNVSTTQNLFGIVNAATQERFQFGSNNYGLAFIYAQGTSSLITSALLRDVSAWYHIVLAVDTDQGTASNRIKIYINGVLQTLTGTYPSSGYQFDFNNSIQHRIGSFNDGAGNYHYADYYLADVHVIDGQALAASDFGELDSNSVWQPKKFAGTYGTNGFHLDFSANSSNAALGTDASGNGNTWTVNNIQASDGTRYSYNIATMTNEKNDSTDSLSNLFDGLLSTTCASTNGTDGTITFSPAITGITSLRIHAQGRPGTGYFVVNGTQDYGNSLGDNVYQWITISGVSSLSSIFIRHVTGYTKTTVQAVEVNGVILVDGAAGDSLVDTPEQRSDQTDSGSGGDVVGNYCDVESVG